MAFDFLAPLNSHFIDSLKKNNNPQALASKVVFHTEEDFPDISKVKIALIGVLDSRGSSKTIPFTLEAFRKEFYSLYPGNWQASIADLGNIEEGNTSEDTYYAVSSIVVELLKKNVIPIIIGGSQDLTYGMYRAFDQLDQMVNLVSIDKKFDLGKDQVKHTDDSFLSKIIINEPNNLFNYSNIGYQTYFNSQEEIDLIEKLYFDAYRLGEVSADLTLTEPVFRDADVVSMDLTAVKSSDSANFTTFTPNGFNGKEICALSRYSGISDKVSLFGVFGHNDTENEAVLMAQIIWYFIEGVNFRSNEYPKGDRNNFIKYIVPIDDMELVFFKSPKTERWWIEIPFISTVNNKLKKSALLPCTHEDYLRACDQDIPERWWKAQRKNLL